MANEHDVVVFLLSLAALLGTARLLGEVARKLGLPLVVGEITAGLLLGKSALGRISPAALDWLFPPGAPKAMLSGYTTLALVLLLVVAGLEVDLQIVRRRGRTALFTGVLGIVLPLMGGVVLGLLVPDSDLVSPDHRFLFATIMGVALSMSALPVIAKTLLDLGLFKTDIGLLVMTAAMIDDVVGWLAFSVLLEPTRGQGLALGRIALTVTLTLAFVAFAFFVGRRVLDRVIKNLEQDREAGSSRLLSLIIVIALFGASGTQAMGLHAVFGGFIVGVMVGDSPSLRERTRVVIHRFVTNVFAPVFFASLGLRVDFFRHFDARLCLLVFSVATVTKVLGCAFGARAGGLTWREASAIGFGLNARGAMGIVLALLALDAGLLKEEVFVALVTMAIATSLLSGPAMNRLLYRQHEEDVVQLLRRGAFVPLLARGTATGAIDELIDSLGPHLGGRVELARSAVRERELVAHTGLGDEVALPHAAIEGLARPLLALGLAPAGIDFDAMDGKPAKIVFLLLMPPRAYEKEVRVLASISRSVFDEAARRELLRATGLDDAARCLSDNATRIAKASRRPRAASLVDL